MIGMDRLTDELYKAGRALTNVVGTVGASSETWDAIKRLRAATDAHRRSSQAAPVSYTECSKCAGHGMVLGDCGDPRICPECNGDTVAPAPSDGLREGLDRLRIDEDTPADKDPGFNAGLEAARAAMTDPTLHRQSMDMMTKLAAENQALRDRAEAAENERDTFKECYRVAALLVNELTTSLNAARRAEAAGWNDAIEAAAVAAESTPDEMVGTMELTPSQYAVAKCIRALRRATTEGEA